MLQGERTFLRAPELEDSRIISAWLNDRNSNKYLQVIYPVSKRYADSFVLDADEDKSKRMFMIDNENRKPIGLITLTNIKWEYGCCEIGIAIYDKNFRGKGYGRDALTTAISFVFDNMNLHLIYLQADEENVAAIGLYSSLGFQQEGVLRDRCFRNGKYTNLIIMSKINPACGKSGEAVK